MPQALAEKSWTVALRAASADELELSVYDFIGQDFFGDGVSAKDILGKLRAAPQAKTITLRINSGGGVVDDAKAMINLLGDRKAQGVKVNAFIDGIAASAASYLTTVADKVTMASNAFLMFHQARTGRMGNAKDMADTAALLTRTNEQLAEGYAAASARRGKSKTKADYLAAMAKGDTYLDADEAIAWGLADDKVDALKAVAVLADIEALESAPEALKSAAYVGTADVAAPVVAAVNADVVIDTVINTEPVVEPPAETSEAVVVEPTTPAPVVRADPIPTGKENKNMSANTEVSQFVQAITLTLGLPVGSTESDVLARAAFVRDFEKEAVSLTGVASTAEAVGAIRGLASKAALSEALQTELTQVKSERDQQNFDTLLVKGKADGQLVPATIKLYEEEFTEAVSNGRGSQVVSRLKGFLAVQPRVLPQVARQVAAHSGAALVWEGKAYADLKPLMRARLSQENPDLYREMKRDFDASQSA